MPTSESEAPKREPIVVFQITVHADPVVVEAMQDTARIRAEKAGASETLDSEIAKAVAGRVLDGLSVIIRQAVPMIAAEIAAEIRKGPGDRSM